MELWIAQRWNIISIIFRLSFIFIKFIHNFRYCSIFYNFNASKRWQKGRPNGLPFLLCVMIGFFFLSSLFSSTLLSVFLVLFLRYRNKLSHSVILYIPIWKRLFFNISNCDRLRVYILIFLMIELLQFINYIIMAIYI